MTLNPYELSLFTVTTLLFFDGTCKALYGAKRSFWIPGRRVVRRKRGTDEIAALGQQERLGGTSRSPHSTGIWIRRAAAMAGNSRTSQNVPEHPLLLLFLSPLALGLCLKPASPPGFISHPTFLRARSRPGPQGALESMTGVAMLSPSFTGQQLVPAAAGQENWGAGRGW